MILPKEEQRVYDTIKSANGKPLRAVEIAETIGIQDNHCVKLIKYLTDKGCLDKENRRYVTINGKKKSYKEYWIPSDDPDTIARMELLQQCKDLRDNYPINCPERDKIEIQIKQIEDRLK